VASLFIDVDYIKLHKKEKKVIKTLPGMGMGTYGKS